MEQAVFVEIREDGTRSVRGGAGVPGGHEPTREDKSMGSGS
jgi:hypothetical protein